MGSEENVMADDLPPSLRDSGDVPPSMRTEDQQPPSMRESLGEAAGSALSKMTNPKEIWKSATTPIAPIERFRKGVDEALTGVADKLTPSEGDIEGAAQKTGKIPYGKIIEKTMADTGAHFLSGMIPASPIDFAMMYGAGKALKIGGAEVPGEIVPRATISGDALTPEVLSREETPAVKKVLPPQMDTVGFGPVTEHAERYVRGAPEEFKQIQGFYDHPDIKVRRDARKILRIMSDRVEDDYRTKKLLDLNSKDVLSRDDPRYTTESRLESSGHERDVMDAFLKKGSGLRKAEVVDPKMIVDDVAKETVRKVIPESLMTPEHMSINEDTSKSFAPKALGVPDAMVDSSPKLKGTDQAPALKPEIIPGTRSFSQDIWNRLIIPAAQAVAKQGQWGQSLAQDLIRIRDVPDVRYGMEFGADFEQLYNKIPELFKFDLAKDVGIEEEPSQEMVGKMTEQLGDDVRKMLEGSQPTNELTPNLRILRNQIAEASKAGLQKISDWAQVANDGEPIKIHQPNGKVVDWSPRENYFPQMMKPEILEALVREDKGKMSELAAHFLKQRMAPNSFAAMEQVKLFRRGLIDKKFSNIEMSRKYDLPEEFYETNAFKVIPNYMRTAYARLSQIETFGLNDEKAIGKIMNIGYEGHDEDLALRVYRRATGRDPVDAVAKGMFRALRNWSTASLIQFQTTLYHLPRTLYPAMEAGYFKAAKALINSFGDASEIEARRMGINLSKSMSEFLQEEYGGGKTMSGKAANLTMNIEGIKPLDRFDRKYSSILGKDWIENDLVKTLLKKPGNKNARVHLQEFGIDPDKIIKAGKIDPLDLNVAAKRFSDRWQGNPDPTTLPLWATTHPYINMMFQFKNFMYVISREMAHSIATAAKTGDVATLARFATLPMAGATVYGIRHAIGMNDTQYVKNPKLNMALNILRDTVPLPVGTDVLLKIIQGKKGVKDLLIPPSLANVVDLAGDIGESISSRKVSRENKKDLARHIPLVGTAISHRL